MALSRTEMVIEDNYLDSTLKEISDQLQVLGKQIHINEEQITKFKKFLWESKGSMDKVEMQTNLMASEMEANFMIVKMDQR